MRDSIKNFVCDFIAHTEWWFANDTSIDKMLADKYYGSNDCERFLEIAFTLGEICDVDTIIYLDQIGRHLMRIGIISRVSFDYVYVTILNCAINVNLDTIDVDKKCFILLAIRHSRNLDIIKKYVVPHIGTCEKMNRFRKATIEVIGQLTIPSLSFPRKDYYKNCSYSTKLTDEENKKYINFLSTSFSPTEEECKKFINDDDLNLPNVVIKGVFMPNENYLISLSGGVDSTILTLIAKNDKRFKGCVHINYTNRPSSDYEEEYVRRICKDINVPLYVRRIDEINRVYREGTNADRTFYEDYTRKVRFAAYAYALKELDATCVLLGHNACDVEENIITNTIDGTHYENLKGMTYESNENGIKIIRPFIEIKKQILVNIANTKRIPYVWNSTPSWSRRGQIRSSINTIDPKIITGMVKISDEMQELYKLLHESTNAINYDLLDDNNLLLTGNFINIESAWKIIFHKVAVIFHTPYVSKKCIQYFQQNYNSSCSKKFIISKNLICYTIAASAAERPGRCPGPANMYFERFV